MDRLSFMEIPQEMKRTNLVGQSSEQLVLVMQ
jgi:hypothetical protein